ncbi:MAG: DUF4193 family protein [Actinomycetota bacterium]
MNNVVDDEEESEGTEASLDELLAKRAEEKADAEEEESILDLNRTDEGAESLGTIKVVPQQADEFTCRSCFLVKHRSQLADKKKMICRDCA